MVAVGPGPSGSWWVSWLLSFLDCPFFSVAVRKMCNFDPQVEQFFFFTFRKYFSLWGGYKTVSHLIPLAWKERKKKQQLKGLGTLLNFSEVFSVLWPRVLVQPIAKSWAKHGLREGSSQRWEQGSSRAWGWACSLKSGHKNTHSLTAAIYTEIPKRLNSVLAAAHGVVPAFEIWE